MKKIRIEIRIGKENGKIATAIQTEGYDKENISHQLELLGVLESTKDIIKDRIDVLLNVRK